MVCIEIANIKHIAHEGIPVKTIARLDRGANEQGQCCKAPCASVKEPCRVDMEQSVCQGTVLLNRFSSPEY